MIAILATAGFMLAAYIHFHKRTARPLVCPIGHQCDAVIHSDYSKFFEVPVEILGMMYYAVIAVSYFVFPGAMALRVLTGAAFGFSLYLVSIQLFVLKQWCTWCLCSAALCTGIFILSFL